MTTDPAGSLDCAVIGGGKGGKTRAAGLAKGEP
jgi:hypothetical protein